MLAGRRVECVFDPFDLTHRRGPLERQALRPGHSRSTSAGTPIPRPSRRTPAAPPPATGIDYLGIIAAEHEQAARRHRIRYDALRGGDDDAQEDGQ